MFHVRSLPPTRGLRLCALHGLCLSVVLALAGGVSLSEDGSDAEGIAATVVKLGEKGETTRTGAQKRLLEIGPSAIPEIVVFMRRSFDDKDETIWRAAFETVEQIVKQHRDDPHLDDGLLRLPPPDTKNAVFGGIDFIWIPGGWFVAGSTIDPFDRTVAYNRDKSYGEVRKVWLDGFWIHTAEKKMGPVHKESVRKQEIKLRQSVGRYS